MKVTTAIATEGKPEFPCLMQDKNNGIIFLMQIQDKFGYLGTKISVPSKINGVVGECGYWSGDIHPYNGTVTLSSED